MRSVVFFVHFSVPTMSALINWALIDELYGKPSSFFEEALSKMTSELSLKNAGWDGKSVVRHTLV